MEEGRSGRRRTRRFVVSVTAVSLLLGATLTTAAQARYSGHSTAARPAYGGSYSYWVATAPDCLDPQKTGEASSNGIDNYILDPLLALDDKGHYVGDLARTYKISNGGLRITFQLRKGVKFSNGDPFDANAVKFTFDRAQDPTLKSPVSAGQLAQVTGTKIVSKYVVQVTLKTPFRPVLTNLGNAYTGILDPKATRAGNTCEKPIGTGPYKVQSTGPAFSTVTLVANKYHKWAVNWVHNKKGVPYVSKVVFKTIASDATAISELLSSGIDYVAGIPGTQLSRVTGNKKVVLHKVPTQGESFMEFNASRAPFNTLAGRKAVAEIIDRAAIIKAAFAGQAKPVYNAIPPAIPFYDKKAEKSLPHLNTSDAAKLIQANHLTGPYDLLIVPIPSTQTAAEIIQASAAQVGMKINIVSKALADYIPAARNGQFDMLLLSYGYPDPDILYLLLHSSQSKGLNFTHYTNATLDRLLVQGRETLKNKAAQKAYSQALTLINKQVIFVGTTVPTSVVGIRSTIRGYHVNAGFGPAIQDLYLKSK